MSGGFSGSVGSRYTLVDDHPDATGSDYMECNTNSGGHIIFGFTATTLPSAASDISVAVVYYDNKIAGAGATATSARLRIGGVDYSASTHNTTFSTWTLRTDTWATNPATSAAWTAAEVNAIQGFGIQGTDWNPDVLISSIALVAEYTPAQAYEAGLAVDGEPAETPISRDDHYFRYQFSKSESGGETVNLTLRIMEDETVIREYTETDISATPTTVEQALTNSEASAIGFYSDLSVQVEFQPQGNGTARDGRLYWVEFQVPPAGVPEGELDAVLAAFTLAAASVVSVVGTAAATMPTFTSSGQGFTETVADRFDFDVEPSNANEGVAISPAITVRAEDSEGTLDQSFTGDVSLAIGNNPGSGTLSGTTTVAAVLGVATFSNLSINNAGVGYTLVASGTLTSTTSAPFNITVAQLARARGMYGRRRRIYE